MGQLQIVIRYYNAQGGIVYEDEPNLGHRFRVPVGWVRWEIYWGEVLVQSGERAPERPGSGRGAAPSRAGRPSR